MDVEESIRDGGASEQLFKSGRYFPMVACCWAGKEQTKM